MQKNSNLVKVSDIQTIDADDFFDVIIIGGAGPHALGAAARLREPRPASLYTDIEHSRLSFLQRPGYVSLPRQPKRPYKLRPPPSSAQISCKSGRETFPKILALDSSSSTWLGRWNGFFHHLSIQHLRSPMFFHPGPADVDGLEAYAQKVGQEDECAESGGVETVLQTVGQSQRGGDKVRKRASSKKIYRFTRSLLGHPINERERSSYARPTSKVFKEFCESELVERYNLNSVLHKEEVVELNYGILHIKTEGHGRGFSVTCKGGKKYGAKYVLMAIGGQEIPRIPDFLKDFTEASVDKSDRKTHQGPGWCHSRCFSYGGTEEFKRAVKISSTTGSSVVVIGGGLTSAQISDLAIRSGARKVILICRGYLKTKHYDFPLSWVTKYSNLEKMSFWQEDCRIARLKMVKNARNGGSVNPSTLQLLKRRMSEGTLDLLTHTTVQKATRDPETNRWRLLLSIQQPIKSTESTARTNPKFESLEDVAFIVSSTGGKLDFSSIPFISSLLQETQPHSDSGSINSRAQNIAATSAEVVPVAGVVEGLPFLTEDLQWGDKLPLFVLGAYAALELGPDAGNLSGTRGGAERVVSKLNELLSHEWFIDNPLSLAQPVSKAAKNKKTQLNEYCQTISSKQQSKEDCCKFSSSLSPSDPGQKNSETGGKDVEAEEESITPSCPVEFLPTLSENEVITKQLPPIKISARRLIFKMGARERRAGNIGGWFEGLEEVEA
ncbi:hypothetical protein PPACK8108_LOCUS14552 [Phakopsora pachyrhizi]|uniref:L-ornithine N(5)-oxygenase n=1 Tax=Phakopsora pachyrhizi TaxID=170000 RepID=A0AAV0B772_PHAPC|nr:hypothetical protein PPACK8108_LOCUS14552 [Phakopsora pachyrhizi]